MKVLNLRCAQGHGFEGWFGSEADFVDQSGRGVVECPLCGDQQVTRLPSAPRLNLSGAREPAAAPATPAEQPAATATGGASATAPAEMPVALQALWLQAVQQVLKNTEDVGERFPEEVRRIHYGETAYRGIRGQASAEQRAELADEGIEVMPLPLPVGLKGNAH
jgi:hypothetical protein